MIPRLRAWWIEQEVMCDVDVIGFSEGAITVSNENTTYEHLGLNEVELMQSTRLKDMNGMEIFEGDIVKVTDDDGSTDFLDGGIGTICGLDELYMWYVDGQVHNGLFDISQQYYIEVIGNVHENPELMEVQE